MCVLLAGGPPPGGGAPWHLRNVLSDSVESSDDEFFDARGEYTPFSYQLVTSLETSGKRYLLSTSTPLKGSVCSFILYEDQFWVSIFINLSLRCLLSYKSHWSSD